MYRRSVITDEISQNFDDVLKVARAFSLDGLEIRSVWDTRVDRLDDAAVRRLREETKRAEMVVCAVAPPFYKCDLDDPRERAEHLEILRRAIDVGQRLGTSLIRTFTFWKKGSPRAVWERLVESYREPVAIARQLGATLAVENEYACMVGTGSDLARFVREVNQPEVKALWDPCNAFFEDTDERPFPAGYHEVRDLTVHVHLKDAARDAPGSKPRLTPLGDGAVDVAGQLGALVRDGYTGFVSLETHWRPDALDAETVRLPGGQTFSENAAVATIQCLKNWDSIIQAARPIPER